MKPVSHFLFHRHTPVQLVETIIFDFIWNDTGLIFITLERVSEPWDSQWVPIVIYLKSFVTSLPDRYLDSTMIFKSSCAPDNLILLMVQNAIDALTFKLSVVLLG